MGRDGGKNETYGFALQNVRFHPAKGMVLQRETIPFAGRLFFARVQSVLRAPPKEAWMRGKTTPIPF